jgi:hypothetical protein
MVWPRGPKPHGYVLVQQRGFEDHAENVVSPLMDLSDIRQLVSEGYIYPIVLPQRSGVALCFAIYTYVA